MRFVILLSLIGALAACNRSSSDSTDNTPPPPTEPELDGEIVPIDELPERDALADAPRELDVDGVLLQADQFLSRDFFPPVPPEGRPLRIYGGIQAQSDEIIPSGLMAVEIYVLHEGEAWIVEPDPDMSGREDPSIIFTGAKNGPFWGPDVFVDIVTRLEFDGTLLWLAARDVLISSTH